MLKKEQEWHWVLKKQAQEKQSQDVKLKLPHAGIQVLQALYQTEMVDLTGVKMSNRAQKVVNLDNSSRREVQVLDATLSVHGRT